MTTAMRYDGVLFKQAPDWAGYTTMTNLAKIRQLAPKYGSDIMTYVGTANSEALSYESYLKMIGNTIYDTTDEPIIRMVYGDGRKFAKLIKYISSDAVRVGINKSKFVMVFDTPFFSDVHTIVGLNDRYKIRIVSDPREYEGGWAYDCQTWGSAGTHIPPTELKAGSTWTKEGAPVPMYDSMKGAKTSYSSPYALTYDWSSVSIQDDVPGNMKHVPVVFGWKEGGKEMYTWELYRTWKNDLHFQELKNKTLVWGTSNKNAQGGVDDIDERSGVEIKSGSGVVEQIERGNLHYHNSFDIDELSELILTLRVGKKSSDKLHYVISSGTRGLMQAHKEIEAKAAGWTKISNESIFGDKMNLGFGHRFTRYLHPGGFTLDFRFEPLFDDQYRTPVKHPNGGLARSYEYHIMDLGQTQGEDSVELHYIESMADNLGILPGMRSPYSPTGAKNSYIVGSLKDAWSERRMSQFMAIVRNPKNALIYRPNVLPN